MTLTALRPWTPRSVDTVPLDQARSLRVLLERREQWLRPDAQASRLCRTLAVTSGKGGVGKSVIAVNLAVSLAQQGLNITLLDGNPGLGNIDLLCGLNSYWNLSHVIAGSRDLADVCQSGPAGITVVPGASGLSELTNCPDSVQQQLLGQLRQLEADCDLLIIDTGSGLHQLTRQLAATADHVLVIATPEPTSITDAYATIKSLQSQLSPQPQSPPEISVIVNQATHQQSERILDRLQTTARTFLGAGLKLGAGIPFDPEMRASVQRRRPCSLESPGSDSARAIRSIADRIAAQPALRKSSGYFDRLRQKLRERS